MKLVGSQKQFHSCWKATTASCRVCHQKLLSGERAVKRFLSTPSLPASPPFPTLPSFPLHPLYHLEYLHHFLLLHNPLKCGRGGQVAFMRMRCWLMRRLSSQASRKILTLSPSCIAAVFSSVHLCSPSFVEWRCSKLVLLQAFRGFFVRQQQGDT